MLDEIAPKVQRKSKQEQEFNAKDSLEYMVSCLDEDNVKELKNILRSARDELLSRAKAAGRDSVMVDLYKKKGFWRKWQLEKTRLSSGQAKCRRQLPGLPGPAMIVSGRVLPYQGEMWQVLVSKACFLNLRVSWVCLASMTKQRAFARLCIHVTQRSLFSRFFQEWGPFNFIFWMGQIQTLSSLLSHFSDFRFRRWRGAHSFSFTQLANYTVSIRVGSHLFCFDLGLQVLEQV